MKRITGRQSRTTFELPENWSCGCKRVLRRSCAPPLFQTVYEWKPTSDGIAYVATCLVLQLNKIIGDIHPNKQVPCM